MCLKCKTEVGTLTHCLWSCNRLQRYWFLVLGEMEKIFNMQLDFDPVSLVLGIPNKCIVSSANKKLYNILSFAARKNILLNWISDKSPSLKGWHKIIFELIPLGVLPMYYIKKQVSFIKSGLHIWTIWNLIFALLYYKEYCNCVILWTFNFSAVFNSFFSFFP